MHTADSDFVQFNNSITLRQGSSSVKFNVTILNDDVIEPMEKTYQMRFDVLPHSAEYAEASIQDRQAFFNIIDDDGKISVLNNLF